jgi:hypothetical protein
MAASDEPPVHVKGGSIDFTLLPTGNAPGAQWVQDSSAMEWSVDKGHRQNDKLGLLILANVSGCPASASGLKTVEIVFRVDNPKPGESADKTITLTGKVNGNNKSHVSSVVPLTQANGDPTTLTYDVHGYIASIKGDAGHDVDCHFATKTDLQEFYVFEQ